MEKNARLTYRNTLTGIESDCTFRVDFSSLMNNISCSKQSSLFLHSLEHRRASVGLQGPCLVCLGSVCIQKMTVVYVHPHLRVSVRITQVTLKTINDALLVYDLWLFLFNFQVQVYFTADEHRLDFVCTFRLRSLSYFLT